MPAREELPSVVSMAPRAPPPRAEPPEFSGVKAAVEGAAEGVVGFSFEAMVGSAVLLVRWDF